MSEKRTVSTCPNRVELEQFAAREHSEPALAAHIGSCPACRDAIAVIESDNAFLRDMAGVPSGVYRRRDDAVPPTFDLAGYTIVREIHRGGQGVVYHAIQKSTHRDVAIKVMREGPFAGLSERMRFEREVQVLAQLDHPSIVAIHDSGTASGCFFFVMDYIRGDPLDVWLKRPNVTISDRLALFIDLCEAVHAAHLRGVIHRDLKPANILVCEETSTARSGSRSPCGANGSPDASRTFDDSVSTRSPRGGMGGRSRSAPKILDFGLAKTEFDSHDMTVTRDGQFLGSPAWASPEQAAGDPLRIDVRSDVYSLGVLLYFMLTRAHPYPISPNLHEMIQRVRTVEPLPPSRVAIGLDHDLDTIALKCLAKERERRYQSAGDLAADVERYLAGEPIDAKRDSRLYVLRKTILRHKALCGAITAILLALVIGSIAVIYGLAEAHAAARTAAAAAEREAYERARAAGEASKSRAAVQVLSELMLPTDPIFQQNSSGWNPLDEWIENGQFAGQPEIEASVRTLVAGLFREKDLMSRAEVQLRSTLRIRLKALGSQHPEVAQTLVDLADVLLRRGSLTEAERRCREALAIQRRVPGGMHVDVIRTLNTLARIFLARRDYDQADAVIREAQAACAQLHLERHVEVARTLDSLSRLQSEQGQLEPAEASARRALVTWIELLPDRHPSVIDGLKHWSQTLMQIERAGSAATTSNRHPFSPEQIRDAARELRASGLVAHDTTWRTLLTIKRNLLGDGHVDLAETLLALGRDLVRHERLREAEPAFREALEIFERAYGEDALLVGECLHDLRTVVVEPERYREAAELAQRRYEIYLRQLSGADDVGVIVVRREAAWAWLLAGDPTRAEQELRATVAMSRERLGGDHLETGRAHGRLGQLLLQERRYAEAEEEFRRAIDIHERIVSPVDVYLTYERTALGDALLGQGRLAVAEAAYLDAVAALDIASRGAEWPAFARDVPGRLAEVYAGLGVASEAARWQRICDGDATPGDP